MNLFNLNTNIYIYSQKFSSIPIIEKIAYFISYPLSYVLPIFILIFLIFKNKQKIYTFSLLFVTGLFSWLGSVLLKIIFHIPRPVDHGVFFDIGKYSFPSTHTVIYAALIFAVGALRPSWTAMMITITILIGISRIVLGVHTPIDIIGGFAVGSIIGYWVTGFFRKYDNI